MRERISDYLNEIISLVFMVLLAFALVSGPQITEPGMSSANAVAKDRAAPIEAVDGRRW